MRSLQIILKSGFIFLTFSFLSASAQDDAVIREIEEHRAKEDEKFRGDKSPIPASDRQSFKGVNYYPIDLKYRVTAKFVRTEGLDFFKMKTTTTRSPEYVKYGEVHFQLEGKDLKLEVYQSPDVMKMQGYEDYLFIPFTDLTNGLETYEVGRYLEFRIPKSDDVILDFNKCYNPYCAYGGAYSCPIPPEPNQLQVEIPAGEKKYKD